MSKQPKPKCPDCGSADVKVMKLPLEDDEYIYCNKCKNVNIITKVDVDVK